MSRKDKRKYRNYKGNQDLHLSLTNVNTAIVKSSLRIPRQENRIRRMSHLKGKVSRNLKVKIHNGILKE